MCGSTGAVAGSNPRSSAVSTVWQDLRHKVNVGRVHEVCWFFSQKSTLLCAVHRLQPQQQRRQHACLTRPAAERKLHSTCCIIV